MVSEKLAREFDKVNMEALENMNRPGTDKMRQYGKGAPRNQFR